MSETINENQNLQETDEMKKTRVKLEKMLFKLLFFAAAVGDCEGSDKFIDLQELEEYKYEIERTSYMIASAEVSEFTQEFEKFIRSNLNNHNDEDEILNVFFDFCSSDDKFKQRFFRKTCTFLNYTAIMNDEYDDSNDQHVYIVNTYKEILKKFWQEKIINEKSFMFRRENVFTTSCMVFSTIPHHFLNEPGRRCGIFQSTVAVQLESVCGKEQAEAYLKQVAEMLKDEKPWYTDVAKYYHKSNKDAESYKNNVAILLYGIDKYNELNKDGKFGLREILAYREYEDKVKNQSDKKALEEAKNIDKAMRGVFLSKYYEDRMIACMFDQSLLETESEIDKDTIDFWRMVFENTHQEYAESLIIFLNHSDDKTVRDVFLNEQFRQNCMQHPEIIEPLIVLATFDKELFKKYINETEEAKITSDSSYDLCKVVFDEIDIKTKYQIGCRPNEVEQKISSSTFKSRDFLNFCLIYPENCDMLAQLSVLYPDIFSHPGYSWKAKAMVAKALIPMKFDVRDFNAVTLEPFLSICKTPEEFRVAYLLWQNTNFINQFWLMKKVTHEDLVAIVNYVGNDINNKDKLIEKVAEIYNKWPAFAEKGWFAGNLVNSLNENKLNKNVDVQKAVKSIINYYGDVLPPQAKANLIANLSNINHDNLEKIRFLFLKNPGKEKKVLDYIATILEAPKRENVIRVRFGFDIDELNKIKYDLYQNKETKVKNIYGQEILLNKSKACDIFATPADSNLRVKEMFADKELMKEIINDEKMYTREQIFAMKYPLDVLVQYPCESFDFKKFEDIFRNVPYEQRAILAELKDSEKENLVKFIEENDFDTLDSKKLIPLLISLAKSIDKITVENKDYSDLMVSDVINEFKFLLSAGCFDNERIPLDCYKELIENPELLKVIKYNFYEFMKAPKLFIEVYKDTVNVINNSDRRVVRSNSQEEIDKLAKDMSPEEVDKFVETLEENINTSKQFVASDLEIMQVIIRLRDDSDISEEDKVLILNKNNIDKAARYAVQAGICIAELPNELSNTIFVNAMRFYGAKESVEVNDLSNIAQPISVRQIECLYKSIL